jgi:hypothetical protein
MKREFAGFLTELAADAPLALIIDDLDWADPSTIELLAYLDREFPRNTFPPEFAESLHARTERSPFFPDTGLSRATWNEHLRSRVFVSQR